MHSSKQILQQFWGYDSFRGEQEKIIHAVLDKKDVLALLPTGGGKSICFQVPALMMDGICLVISPLIALMKDQVENLQQKNIAALYINSSMSYNEVDETLQKAVSGAYKFLYVSPERLQTNLFKDYLSALNISLLAIDEAHCISQWGYDFRPAYLNIISLRKKIKNIAVIALTASATPEVQKDIIQQLQFLDYKIFQQSFERKNLSFSVYKVESKINKLIQILNSIQGSAIVYCKTRKQTKTVSDLLQLQNISADFYHAGLHSDERNVKQQNWMNNTLRVMVCTNAFGMGIDKPNVRSVIHFDVTDCLENYYQEAGRAGRAGRDGEKSYAVLLYEHQDEIALKSLPNERFPNIDEIKKVYQSVADYLQIPIGIGEGNYYNFDVFDFCKKFQLNLQITINALKILEQENFITFSENIFIPSHVEFIADKNILVDIENLYPNLDAVAKCLLRTYSGILDNSIAINEKQIAKLCRLPYEKIYEDLKQLHKIGVIQYKPQKETPQIFFVTNRASAATLEINYSNYFERKKQFEKRVNTMLDYLHLNSCRSKFIANYFGDENGNDCGVCDDCLQKKKTKASSEEQVLFIEQIFNSIPKDGINIQQLIQQYPTISKEDFWKAVEFLQAEGKITQQGMLIKKL